MLILEIWFSNSDVINGERELSFDTVLQFSSDDNKLSLDLQQLCFPLQYLIPNSGSRCFSLALAHVLLSPTAPGPFKLSHFSYLLLYGWFSGESSCRKPWLTKASVARFLNDKRHALTLLLVVESQATDVSIWICLFALLDFLEDLGGVGASKHGELPQCPVPSIVVSRHPAVLPAYAPQLSLNIKSHKKRLK
ncbi:hypothetical protein NC651_038735 [Populus alba x Populus x berolinensis]|nr:hypothetical protein NC651_038735 [Populus alba x Populus x berolinensis]